MKTEKQEVQATELITASEVTPKDLKWLWYPYFPLGKVSIVQGDPGDGKSTFLLTIAALLSKGDNLPFCEDGTLPVKVIYQTTEDDLEDTVVPRFIKAGGNLENLVFIKEDVTPLTFADERISVALQRTGAKLLILDPLSSYIGECSLNSANEVRPQFNHLIKAAKENECAIIVVDHMNKGEAKKVLYRTIGSIDVVGAVRSMITIIRDPEDTDKRYFIQTKSNLAKTGNPFSFSVSDNGIEFIEELDATVDELLAKFSSAIGRPAERIDEAKAEILDMLADGKQHPAKECMGMLIDAGIKKSTAKLAKKDLGVLSVKSGEIWYWILPDSNKDTRSQ